MADEPNSPINDRIKRNIESIAGLEKTFERQRTLADRVSDAVSGFGGSIRFIVANAVIIAGWLLWNLALPPGWRFDPGLAALQLLIGGEALFLSAFVLMSQNRQTRQADHWAHVALQISMLSEQETTKLLQMMQNVCRFLGMDKAARDTELKQMAQQVPMTTLVEEVGKSRQAEDTGLLEIAAVLVEETLAERKAAGPAAEKADKEEPGERPV